MQLTPKRVKTGRYWVDPETDQIYHLYVVQVRTKTGWRTFNSDEEAQEWIDTLAMLEERQGNLDWV